LQVGKRGEQRPKVVENGSVGESFVKNPRRGERGEREGFGAKSKNLESYYGTLWGKEMTVTDDPFSQEGEEEGQQEKGTNLGGLGRAKLQGSLKEISGR